MRVDIVEVNEFAVVVPLVDDGETWIDLGLADDSRLKCRTSTRSMHSVFAPLRRP